MACAPEVLGQILRNVMGNALKYRVPERTCRLEVSTRVETFSVPVEVVDNGQGMEPEAAQRAFEPFFRGTAEGSGPRARARDRGQLRARAGRLGAAAVRGRGGDPGLDPATPDAPREVEEGMLDPPVLRLPDRQPLDTGT